MRRKVTIEELKEVADSFVRDLFTLPSGLPAPPEGGAGKPRKRAPKSPRQARTPGQALVVGLYGELGSGKTVFTKEVARALNVEEHVVSPTFVIERIYHIPAELSKQLSEREVVLPELRRIRRMAETGVSGSRPSAPGVKEPSSERNRTPGVDRLEGGSHPVSIPREFPFDHLIHIDAYRLESEEDLEKLGWNDILADPRNLIFIEWADRVRKLLPKDHIQIHFKHIDEKTRQITFNM